MINTVDMTKFKIIYSYQTTKFLIQSFTFYNLKRKMKEALQSSPKIMKKTQGFSTTSLQKQKTYLPSRYAHEKISNPNQVQNILSSIQTNVKSSQIQRNQPSNSPIKIKAKQKQKIIQFQKKKQASEFKSKPLKRQENDFQNYKQIFINPIKQNLEQLQKTVKSQNFKFGKQLNKDYDKLLQFQNSNRKNQPQQLREIKETQITQHLSEAIQLLDNNSYQNNFRHEEDFYSQQIRIQPPDLPNSSTASTLSPGSGYAPSIPLSSNQPSNLKQLLMRAKAGMNTQDIQKQAHLSFYLGVIFEQQRNYSSALKFYRRFLGFAKAMQDRIGMALGANRVGVNYFYYGDVAKSITFHNQNLKLSDNENCFAGFYNLGICHRNISKFQQSIQYFETALQWASQNGEAQSECITYGQLGITYKVMELYQKSLQNFENSLQICRKLKKTKLQQLTIMNILLLLTTFKLSGMESIQNLAYQGYQCSKALNQKKMQQVFSVNLGIIKGWQQFSQQKQQIQSKYSLDVQQQ